MAQLRLRGSSFQLVGHVGTSKDAGTVVERFVTTWVRIFGYPEIVVVDPGTEFQGYVGGMVASSGVAIFPTDARTPWQHGRTERRIDGHDDQKEHIERHDDKGSEEEELLPNPEKVAQVVDVCRTQDKQPLLLTHLLSGQSVHHRKKVTR